MRTIFTILWVLAFTAHAELPKTKVEIETAALRSEAELKVIRQRLGDSRNNISPATLTATADEQREEQQLLQQWLIAVDQNSRHLRSLLDVRRLNEERAVERERWHGFSEKPTAAIAESLTDHISAERLELRSAEMFVTIVESEIARSIERLNAARKQARLAGDLVEQTGVADLSRQRQVTLAQLRTDAATAAVQAAETGRLVALEAVAGRKAHVNFLERKREEARRDARITKPDLEAILFQINQKRAAIQKELEDAIAVPEEPSTSAELRQARVETKRQRIEMLRGFLLLADYAQTVWADRYWATETRPLGELRRKLQFHEDKIAIYRQWKELVEQTLSATSAQLLRQTLRSEAAVLSASDRKLADQLHATLQERAMVDLRAVGALALTEELAARLRSDLNDQIKRISFIGKARAAFEYVAAHGRQVWNVELYIAEDSVIANGQKVSVPRSITFGKVGVAVTLFILGLIAARLGYLSVKKLRRCWIWQDSELAARGVAGLIAIVSLVVAMASVRIPWTVFAFMGGALAIGIGFGAQTLINNFISGVILLCERSIRVGDIVEIDDQRGKVVRVGFRNSLVSRGDGIETLIPNSQFLEKKVVNWTLSDDLVRHQISVSVAYGSSSDMVFELIHKAVSEQAHILKTPAADVLLDEFGEKALVFTLQFWMHLAAGVDGGSVRSGVRTRIYQLFGEAGIQMVSPHRDVRLDAVHPIEVKVVDGPRVGGRFRRSLATLSLLCCVGAVSAQEALPARPRVALVLSGGAARGSAHVGVLKVFEENHVPIDFVVGTSMGAIIGGMYASGLSPQEMEETLTSTDWNDLFTDRPARKHLSFRRKQEDLESLIKVELGWNHGITLPSSLIAGDKLMFFLRKLTLHNHGITSFDQLPIPFRAVATDVENGDMVILDHGDLAEALRASMAIPGAFSPQEIDGRLLVDGFLTQNLPVSVALATGADVIVAVDVGSPLYKRDELKSIVKMSGLGLALLSRKNTKEQISLLRTNDILIQPNLGSIRGLSFDRSREAIDLGQQTAQLAAEKLRQYALSPQEYDAWIAARRRKLRTTVRIDSVRVENGGSVSTKTIEKRIGIKPGQEMKVEELRDKLDRVYDIGSFEMVDYSLKDQAGQTTLVVDPREKSAGRVHVRAGLQLFSDLDGDSDFNFLVNVTATELNQRGAEWKNKVQFGRTSRVYSEFYQPLDNSRSLFVAPYAQFEQDRVEGILADGGLFRAKYRTVEGGLDAGAQLGNFGEIRIGPLWGRTKAYEVRGLTLPHGVTHVMQGSGHLRLALDQFDNVNFPRHGFAGGFEILSSQKALGSDLDYNRLSGGWNHAFSFGENTVLAGFNFGAKLGEDLPFYEYHSLGGFLNLSGYPFQGISDQYSGLGRLLFYRRVLKFNNRAIEGIYAGGSAEIGGVWHRFEDIDSRGLIFAGSAFVGADTILGPLYLAYGQAEGGNHAFYFYLGRGF